MNILFSCYLQVCKIPQHLHMITHTVSVPEDRQIISAVDKKYFLPPLLLFHETSIYNIAALKKMYVQI